MPNKHVNFIKALQFANKVHWDQTRKGTKTPYIAHPMAVASLVMENGGTAEEVMAALLHDVVEDSEKVGYEDIESRFGSRVAEIVLALSDANPTPGESKGPWKERKLAYIKHLKQTPDESVLKVSCADKLHNARTILADLKDPRVGAAVWDKFKASREETLWYYETLAEIFNSRIPGMRLAVELADVVQAIRKK